MFCTKKIADFWDESGAKHRCFWATQKSKEKSEKIKYFFLKKTKKQLYIGYGYKMFTTYGYFIKNTHRKLSGKHEPEKTDNMSKSICIITYKKDL